jgi:release factor glutamine methyltransferase
VEQDIRSFKASSRFDLVVSNPPYIPSRAVDRLERQVRDWESRAALDGGEHGLTVIQAVLDKASQVLRPGGVVLLEID